MKNKCSSWCTLMGILGYFMGVVYAFTLILIPIAVYCFIGAKVYMERADLTDSQLATYKKSMTYWSIFFSIVAFPIGLFSIIPALKIDNNITITDVEVKAEENKKDVEQPEVKIEENKSSSSELSDIETIEKLKNLKDEGLITQEEFERAKGEVLNKK